MHFVLLHFTHEDTAGLVSSPDSVPSGSGNVQYGQRQPGPGPRLLICIVQGLLPVVFGCQLKTSNEITRGRPGWEELGSG